MKKNLILSILLSVIFIPFAFSEVAIIKDKDGYTNVRKAPDVKSEIIHKIYRHEVFEYVLVDLDARSNWIPVYISKNKFSQNLLNSDEVSGYIHRSRFKPLDELPEYKGAYFIFKYEIEPFNSVGRLIDTMKETKIDGREAWGVDGFLPSKQVSDIKVFFEDRKLTIPKALYSDIFECKESVKIYKNDDTYFVYQGNSDGAGSYEIVWVLSKAGLKQRLLSKMYR